MTLYTIIIKPILDRSGALILLILLGPLLIAIAVMVSSVFRSSPIFCQRRAGRLGRGFTLYKFRSMEGDSIPLLGRILRTCSLDELPQLVNILLGDMSFIGPRPLYLYYVQLYNQQQIRRLDIKPGLTGWAQIHGRNPISWKHKFELDLYYVDHIGLWMDIRICYLTIIQITRSFLSPTTPAAGSDFFNGDN